MLQSVCVTVVTVTVTVTATVYLQAVCLTPKKDAARSAETSKRSQKTEEKYLP